MELCDKNAAIHEQGQAYIEHLEETVRQGQARMAHVEETGRRHIAHLEAKAEQAVTDFQRVEREFAQYRRWPLVRIAEKVTGAIARLRGRTL